MAYRISYKVVSEQGNALKQTAKDMDNYITQLNKIVKNLGNDELLKGARDNLKAFEKQLEDEKAFLNLAGQVLVDVVQAYVLQFPDWNRTESSTALKKKSQWMAYLWQAPSLV